MDFIITFQLTKNQYIYTYDIFFHISQVFLEQKIKYQDLRYFWNIKDFSAGKRHIV